MQRVKSNYIIAGTLFALGIVSEVLFGLFGTKLLDLWMPMQEAAPANWFFIALRSVPLLLMAIYCFAVRDTLAGLPVYIAGYAAFTVLCIYSLFSLYARMDINFNFFLILAATVAGALLIVERFYTNKVIRTICWILMGAYGCVCLYSLIREALRSFGGFFFVDKYFLAYFVLSNMAELLFVAGTLIVMSVEFSSGSTRSDGDTPFMPDYLADKQDEE